MSRVAKSIKVSGRVFDATTGNPIEGGAKVFLSDAKGKPVAQVGTETDGKGNFQLEIPLRTIPNPVNSMIPIVLPVASHITIRSKFTGMYKPSSQKITPDKKVYQFPLSQGEIAMSKEEAPVVVVGKRQDPNVPPFIQKKNWWIYALIGVGAIGVGYMIYKTGKVKPA